MRGVSFFKVGIIVLGFAVVLFVVMLRLPTDFFSDHYYEGCMEQAGQRPATYEGYCRCMADYFNKNYTAYGSYKVSAQVQEYMDQSGQLKPGAPPGVVQYRRAWKRCSAESDR